MTADCQDNIVTVQGYRFRNTGLLLDAYNGCVLQRHDINVSLSYATLLNRQTSEGVTLLLVLAIFISSHSFCRFKGSAGLRVY